MAEFLSIVERVWPFLAIFSAAIFGHARLTSSISDLKEDVSDMSSRLQTAEKRLSESELLTARILEQGAALREWLARTEKTMDGIDEKVGRLIERSTKS